MKKPATPKEKSKKNRVRMLAKHELFCIYMTRPGMNTFDNATLSYAAVYKPELESLSRLSETDDKGKIIQDSPYQRAYHVCGMAGARLMHNDRIRHRINARMLELFADDRNLDIRLAQLAFQGTDMHVALAAVRDVNKLRKRVGMDEPPIPPGAAPITRIQIVMPSGSVRLK